MIVTVNKTADPKAVERALVEAGLWVERFESGGQILLATSPHSSEVDPDAVRRIRGVESVARAAEKRPRLQAQPSIVDVAGIAIGPGAPKVFIAGPCGVESEEQIRTIARRVSALGVPFLRGGAFKPRTSPYAFQGLGEIALRWMRRAADEARMKVVTEALGEEELDLVAELADVVQIGSRNMHNYALLKAAAKRGRPILLKRGMAATIDEWLSAGEYCLLHGAASVVFCERGIRSFDPSTRNVLDLGAVALLSGVMKLPVIVDPSHAAGRRDLLPSLSRAALAAGAAGLMLETHDDPGAALSDGPQALLPEDLRAIIEVTHV